MELITFILLLSTIYLIYKDQQLSSAFRKQFILTTEYIRLLFFIMDEKDGTEEDLKKQIWRSWTYDYSCTGQRDFDKKWSAICEACDIRPIRDEYGITSEVIDGIVHVLYLNKHILDPIVKGYPKRLTVDDLKRANMTNEERLEDVKSTLRERKKDEEINKE